MRTDKKYKRWLLNENGGAMVELSVMMMLFVPLVMLPLYFQDSIRFKLDAQEAVYSTAWDFAFGQYDEKSANDLKGSIQHDNGDIFKNGWSGNKKNKVDPAGPWANFEWSNSSQPATCTVKKGFQKPSGLGITDALLPGQFHDEYTKGGLVTCEGTVRVENHYIPQVFMTEFTGGNNKDMFIEKDQFVTFTDNGEPYKFGVLVDPWCLNKPDKVVDREGNDLFKDRVNFCWGDRFHGPAALSSIITFEVFEAAWASFMMKATSAEILNPPDVTGLLLEYPPRPVDLTATHKPQTFKNDRDPGLGGQSDFWVTPYEDGDGDEYRETYDERDEWYLGCESAVKGDGNCD